MSQLPFGLPSLRVRLAQPNLADGRLADSPRVSDPEYLPAETYDIQTHRSSSLSLLANVGDRLAPPAEVAAPLEEQFPRVSPLVMRVV